MYNHNLIEKKWSAYWEKNQTNKFFNEPSKQKFYVLDMFPYPSGKGLHVGHVKGYTATDIISRYKKACGFNVIHPIGFDAFGLPAEQYAIKTNKSPGSFTKENINNFRRQLKRLGFDYDYDLEVDTTDPNYYKWTQWIFIQLYKKGLAKLCKTEVNWCEQLGTVLANEEVVTNEKGQPVSERGGFLVTKKNTEQWVLKITDYADKLLDGLDLINWNNSIKTMQRDWIGKNTGAVINFKIDKNNKTFSAFTTRPDTIFGVTYIAIAPEHELLNEIVSPEQKNKVNNYIEQTNNKSEVQRQEAKTKTGVFTGAYAINPISKKLVPIWVADYVLKNYGTGIVMGVPAHDQRDFEFAKQNNLAIVQVVLHDNVNESAYAGDGVHINSDFLNGLNNAAAIQAASSYIVNNHLGHETTFYKLRDWIFSRQRYWGEPFPILFDDNKKVLLVEDLPLVLPEMESFLPNKDGLPPLANATDWVNVTINNKHYHREVNTMPNWAGSCWYYLGYLMRIGMNGKGYIPLDSKEAKKMFDRFLPVDVYVGGQEHAVLHLLYSRFWHHFLYDIGILSSPEPFMHLINQGMILGEDGTKMAKSKGNVINPDDLIESHGADALRLYEMFMGPITASLPWNSSGLNGSRKWLERVWNFFNKVKLDNQADDNLKKAYNKFIKNATDFLNKNEFNLVISEMMIFINYCYQLSTMPKVYLEGFLVILSFICPFISEELNEFLGNKQSVTKLGMPQFDPTYLIETQTMISCMVNGKFKSIAEFNIDASQEEVSKYFLNDNKVIKAINGLLIKKTIFVKNKVISFIV